MDHLEPNLDTDGLTERIATLLARGRPAAARPLLTAVRRRVPLSPRLAELASQLAMQEGRADLALRELETAIAQYPDHSGLRRRRADVRVRLGDREGAVVDAADAVLLDRYDPSAKAVLGIIMLERGRPLDAVACLREAVAADGSNPAYQEALAAALEASGDADAALATLEAAIAARPNRKEARNAAILLLVRRREFDAACRLAEAARSAGVADAVSFGLMGHALSSLGRHAEAADAYAEALKLGPGDPYVRHLVASAGVQPSAGRAPVEYLRAVFDGYAERFELHLMSLGYRVPGLIRGVLAQHPAVAAGGQLGPVLDLGCGTGMIGVVLSDLPIGPLVGVDVSSRMLAAAADKQLYAELHEADLMRLLTDDVRTWQLVLAGDVLVYFGALHEALAAVHARLASGGWFVFSVEELPEGEEATNGWALGRMGRYAHTKGYVSRIALQTGFAIRQLEHETLRHEAAAPVGGLLVVLERLA